MSPPPKAGTPDSAADDARPAATPAEEEVGKRRETRGIWRAPHISNIDVSDIIGADVSSPPEVIEGEGPPLPPVEGDAAPNAARRMT